MNFITVTNENGKQEKLEILEKLDISGKHYVIVAPENSDEAYAYRVTINGNYEEYESVGVGKEFDMVLQKFNELNNV
jgi:uncharacterized protein YrzB (UPF0473 family)